MYWMNVGRSWIATVPGGLSLVVEKDYESQYRVRFGMAEDGHVYSDLGSGKNCGNHTGVSDAKTGVRKREQPIQPLLTSLWEFVGQLHATH